MTGVSYLGNTYVQLAKPDKLRTYIHIIYTLSMTSQHEVEACNAYTYKSCMHVCNGNSCISTQRYLWDVEHAAKGGSTGMP